MPTMEKLLSPRCVRRLLVAGFALLLSSTAWVWAQTPPAKSAPPPPPLPPIETNDPALEPQVTITKRAEETVEEYRINGKLYMMKVTPAHGVSYYLVDDRGDGVFTRQESLDSGLRVPHWVLFKF
jgi:hypothetical protein